MYYQQGNQRIEIIIRKDGGSTNGGAVAPDQVTSTPKASTGEKSTASPFTNRFIRTNVTHAYAVAKQVGMAVLDYNVQGYGYTTGDQAYQEKVAREVEIFEDFTGVASSVAMGITYGASGGPIGSALGAAFGLVTSGTHLAYKYATRQRDYDYKLFKEENNISYIRSRAGINLTTGRLR